MSHELIVLTFLLLSRLPIYIFVIYKAWKFRNKLLLVSSFWLGAVGLTGMMGALGNTLRLPPIILNLLGTSFAFSLFFLAQTTQVLKVKGSNNVKNK